MPPFRHSPALSQHLTTAHDAWLRRLCQKYGTPRPVLCRQLARPGALEYEIAVLISEAAYGEALRLMETRAWPPDGPDLWDRAVAGCYQQIRDARYAAQEHDSKQLLDQLVRDSA